MNPNLAIFLKTAAKVLVAGFFVFLFFYLINMYTAIDLEKVGAYLMYGFFGIVMVFMMALIIGVTIKSLWINIMRRTDNITLCCLDANNEGVHIVGSHYFSGGESDGYYSYHHYFIRLADGKMFMSTKIQDEKQLHSSLRDLMQQTKLLLKPNISAAIAIGEIQETMFLHTGNYLSLVVSCTSRVSKTGLMKDLESSFGNLHLG